MHPSVLGSFVPRYTSRCMLHARDPQPPGHGPISVGDLLGTRPYSRRPEPQQKAPLVPPPPPPPPPPPLADPAPPEPEEEILGSDDEEQEDPADYCKGKLAPCIRFITCIVFGDIDFNIVVV
ncbi:hypothetical protein J1605_013302 [Eschrichtius robustus]|uniref:Uncharacterized protein n=1 Tax=Eschrichtius robustus TaxID=9764 RepID=A0AB34GIE3_ESCRO|nr:hypothetical protein J1605_013302 [Eschrichtius robustus]